MHPKQAEYNRRWRSKNKSHCRERGALWRKNNPDKVRACSKKWKDNNQNKLRVYWWRKCGIVFTVKSYDEMYAVQNGLCAICLKPEKERAHLSVDHNHATGEIRGLLCHRCNLMLGSAQDSPFVLKNAVKYLKKGERKQNG